MSYIGKLALIILLVATGADASATEDEQINELRLLQQDDQLVVDLAWRLQSAGVKLCPRRSFSLGLSLHTLEQYRPESRAAAGRAFSLGPGEPAVLAVASNSPAALAGVRRNDVLVSVNTELIEAGSHRSGLEQASYTETNRAMALLEKLPSNTVASLVIRRGDQTLDLLVRPAEVCTSRVELVPGTSINGNANGAVAQITGGMLRWTANDDELALVIAHEIAHNALGHAERQGQGGVLELLGLGSKQKRDMEREADKLGTWLAAQAGFNYRIAPTFWERLNKRGGFLATTHPSSANRRRHLEAVVAEIEAAELDR